MKEAAQGPRRCRCRVRIGYAGAAVACSRASRSSAERITSRHTLSGAAREGVRRDGCEERRQLAAREATRKLLHCRGP